MQTVEEMAREIVRREGGFVDNPADPGGATQYGVSLRYAQKIGLDNNGDGSIDEKDIRMVTPAQAVDLYMRDFFYDPGLDQLPYWLHAQLFDIAVNAGAPRAVMLVQEVCNDFDGAGLKEDGVAGPRTVKAVEKLARRCGWKWVSNALVNARIDFYEDLVKRRPQQAQFLRGWTNRAKEFIV